MKRNGFVSNSSSSAFVLLVQEDEHNRVLAELDGWQRAAVETESGKENIFGTECAVISEISVQDSGSWEYDVVDYEPQTDEEKRSAGNGIGEAIYTYRTKLDKDKTWRVDL